MDRPALKFRHATIDDAEAILRVHYAAVHETAVQSYPPQVLDQWSSQVNEERIAKFRQGFIDNPEGEMMIVAEQEGVIIGFGAIIPANNELRAVYVSPGCGRNGVGKAILQQLEDLASTVNVTELNLDASLNAEQFYLNNGYTVKSRGSHKLTSGHEMPCVFMRKFLK